MKFFKEVIISIFGLGLIFVFIFFYLMYGSIFWSKSGPFIETPFIQKIRLGLGILLFLIWLISSIGIIKKYLKK